MVSSVGKPHGMLETHIISSPWEDNTRCVNWCTRVNSSRQASTLACTPVINSSWLSL
jgi:hypothetical protein